MTKLTSFTLPTDKRHLIALLTEKPIAYHVEFARLFDVKTAVFLSQLLYWQGKGKYHGWQYKTAEEWEEETGLNRQAQERCRRVLRDAGVLLEKRHGIPPILHFAIDLDQLERLLTSPTPDTAFPNLSEQRIGTYQNDERIPETTQRLRSITEEPEPTQPSVNPSTHQAMVGALMSVCHQGTEAAKYVARTAKDLREAGYTADQLRAWYGLEGWWYTVHTADWSDKFRKPPSLAQVVKTVQLAAEAHGAAAISVEATRNADGSYNI